MTDTDDDHRPDWGALFDALEAVAALTDTDDDAPR